MQTHSAGHAAVCRIRSLKLHSVPHSGQMQVQHAAQRSPAALLANGLLLSDVMELSKYLSSQELFFAASSARPHIHRARDLRRSSIYVQSTPYGVLRTPRTGSMPAGQTQPGATIVGGLCSRFVPQGDILVSLRLLQHDDDPLPVRVGVRSTSTRTCTRTEKDVCSCHATQVMPVRVDGAWICTTRMTLVLV